MKHCLLPSLCVALLFHIVASKEVAWGQYEVEEESPVWVRGLLDIRIAGGSNAPSWTDRGPGKLRYGGRATATGFEHVTRLAVAQLALEFGATLPWDITARAQLNWEHETVNADRPLLVEAFLRKEWGNGEHGWGLQGGVLNPPFSLEHTGPAWTPQYSLTPSALNTWLWEEARVTGLEAERWWTLPGNLRLSWLVGTGFGPDSFGWLLPERGWVLSDAVSGINSTLLLPRRRVKMFVFDERDYRPALYTGLTLSEIRGRGSIKFGYFDNLGDQSTTGAWNTRFGTVGAILHPLPQVDFLVQYLIGETHTRVANWDSSFSAFYALLSYRYRTHRLTARYDVFRVHDLDGGPNWSRDRGDAVTLAYLFEFGLRHRVGVEYIWAHSRHPSLGRGDPHDDGWQISYRFRY